MTISLFLLAIFFSVPSFAASLQDAKTAAAKAAGVLHLPPGRQCQLCHMQKDLKFVPKKRQPERRHEIFSLKHGTQAMSCNHCHDKNNHNFLRATKAFPASFGNPSPVCFRCHSETFKDWRNGIHGKRTGSWRTEDGNAAQRRQLQCVACHNPHSVPFKPMMALPPPVRREGGHVR